MKSLRYIIVLLILAFIVYFRWLLPTISVGGDWIYYYPISLQQTFLHFGWVGLSNFGAIDLFIWRFPIDLVKSFIGYLHLDSSYSDKLVIFWPSIIVGNIAAFLLVKKVTKSDVAGFIGSLVFNYNTYYFTVNSGYLLYSAGAWSLVSLLFVIEALQRKKISLYLLSGLFLTIAGASDFRVAYITFFIEIFYLVYFEAMTLQSKSTRLKDIVMFALAPCGVFIVLNVYWVLFFFGAHSLSSNDVVSRTLFGNQFLNTMYAFTFFHPFWTGAKTTYFINQQIFFYFWLIPVIAFASIWLHRKNRDILFFGIVALIGIFLTKQVAYPFDGVYTWLFKFFPGFNAFREASKFYFLIATSYAVLIGAFVSYLWSNHVTFPGKKVIKVFLTLVIIFIFIWNVRPILSGDIGDIYVNSHLPSQYSNLDGLYNSMDPYFRILWVPYTTSWVKYENTRPTVNFAYAISTNWNHVISFKTTPDEAPGEIMMRLLHEPYAQNLLAVSSIKYLVVPFVDKANPNIFKYYGEDKSYYTSHLGSLQYLQKVNTGTDVFTVYENPSSRPHIYTTNESEDIHTQLPPLSFHTTYTEKNPTQYSVVVKNVTHPFFLNFSEGYNDGWKIRVGTFNWFGAFNSNYFISDNYHKATNAFLNAYYIDPQIICKNNSVGCVKNNDGSYTMHMTIYFKQQSYLYLGFIISGSVLLIILGYISFLYIKKYGKSR